MTQSGPKDWIRSMSDLTIDFEWIDPLAAKGAEHRATWARLSIVVDRYPVTRVYDERSKTMRDAIYLPLYPLAEWLVEQWWSLWNEPSPSSSADRVGYDERHSFSRGREGYALPPVRIEPAGSLVLVSWSSEKLPSHRLEFPGRGEVWIETETVKDKFSSLVDAVVSRLDANGITDSRLQQEWLAIRTADTDERIFCECTGALGLDPYALDEDQQREIEEVGNGLPKEIVTEFFRAARARLGDLKTDAEEVNAAVARAEGNVADLAPLKELRAVTATWCESSGVAPWEQGYSFAQRLRVHLRLDGSPLKSMESI